MAAVLFAQKEKHQEQLDSISQLEITNLAKEVDLVKAEAMKYRIEADKVPELEAENKRLYFVIREKEDENDKMSNALNQSQAEYHIQKDKMTKMVPKEYLLDSQAELRAVKEIKNSLYKDHIVLCEAIPEYKACIKTYKDEQKSLVKRPDPALEYHGRMLLREMNIKCKSDTTIMEIFGSLCDCVEKLQETVTLWKKRVKLRGSGTGGGVVVARGPSSSAKSPQQGVTTLLELSTKSFLGLGTDQKVPKYLHLPETSEVGNLMLDETTVGQAVKAFWAARLLAKSHETLHDTLSAVLLKLAEAEFNDKEQFVAVGYSFCASLAASEDPECTEFASILRGEMSEAVHMQHLHSMKRLADILQETDSRIHMGAVHGKLPGDKFGEALRACYPSKAADRLVRISGTLKAYKDGEGDLLYAPMCLTGSEVEIALFQQHLEEREEFMAEIIGSVRSEPTAGTGLVSFGGLVRAVLRVDPDSPPEACRRFLEGTGSMSGGREGRVVEAASGGEVLRISDLEAVLGKIPLKRTSCKPSPEAIAPPVHVCVCAPPSCAVRGGRYRSGASSSRPLLLPYMDV